jgi:AraC-like DNA-binding protein
MNGSTYAQWKGFEFAPQGCLLDQCIDLSGPMGLAYERCVDFFKDFHVHDRLMLVFPRGASSMEVRTRVPRRKFRVDSGTFLIVPEGLEHDDATTSAIYDTFALYPGKTLLKSVFEDSGLPSKSLAAFSSTCRLLDRSPWLEQMLQEYFFERVVEKRSSTHARFLEQAIIREAAKLFCKLDSSPTPAVQPPEPADVAVRAIRHIESNLFSPLSNQAIARAIGVSESDLLRKFRQKTGTTPYAFIKDRRLDEAKRLLETTRNSVGDVALLVGYNNFGAFTDAFKAKTGCSPLAWRKSRAHALPAALA